MLATHAVWQSDRDDDAAYHALGTVFSAERGFKSQPVAMRATWRTHINVRDGRLRLNDCESLCG